MILQTKYFDLETDMFSFKNPESIRQQLEEQCHSYFTDEPYNETITTYNDQFKIHLKYKRTNDSLSINFEFSIEDLLFPEVGCIEGYKITNSDYSCRGFKYELNHTYTIEKDPVLCEKGFHFCKELSDCFDYYTPVKASFEIWNLDAYRFLKVRSNGTTYQLRDKYCTNNITILEECTTEEILEAFHKWIYNSNYFSIKLHLRGENYESYDGYFHKVIPGEKLNNQPTWHIYYEED